MSRLDATSLLSPSPTPPHKPTTPRRLICVVSSTLAALGAALSLLLLVVHSAPAPNYGSLFLSLASNDTAALHLRALTLHPHVAGTRANSLTAAYVRDAFSSLSIPAHITPYSVLLSYPIERSLSLTVPGRATTTSFALSQETYPNDPYASATAEVMRTFYAYAASGSVSAEAVYANYGREEDFAYLASRGIDVAGKVAVARYGRIHCEDIVHNARVAGAAAAVVYTDPLQYGGAPGEAWFPDSRWLPPTGVQVGSLFRGVGDPTTPLWASSEGCERVSVEEAMATDDMPGIPALPVSARDAAEIHAALGGDAAPVDWQGREGSPVYRLGPGPAILNLTYTGNDTMATIENVFAVIEGAEEPDRSQQRNGSYDRGWRPRRTIIFCSWDAEEYGLTGSTEWVEENREMLSSRAVAYLNVDVSVVGPVQDPDNSSQTVYDSWVKSNISPLIGRLGDGGSDFSAFVQHVGPGYPVYHSLYDDFVWMEKFGDPGFRRHAAAASIWGMMALKLADEEILPFNYMSYPVELEAYTKVVENEVRGTVISCSPLHNAIRALKKATTKVNGERKELLRQLSSNQLRKDSMKIRTLNDRLMQAERAFTNREGLFKQEWFKHLVYGPSEQNDWESASYPGVDNAIVSARKDNTTESWKFVQHEIHRVARAITQASVVVVQH
uniref:Transferrin receptor-like dimerisation domain-containing protein n=1 Tax=Oryza punctata TaxID=4537 RepID=A0A0E0JIH0_ORYPU